MKKACTLLFLALVWTGSLSAEAPLDSRTADATAAPAAAPAPCAAPASPASPLASTVFEQNDAKRATGDDVECIIACHNLHFACRAECNQDPVCIENCYWDWRFCKMGCSYDPPIIP